jgi:phage/plasmid-like protein (TIGR03299 family)
MSHEIDISNGRANMAYRAATAKPWWTGMIEQSATGEVELNGTEVPNGANLDDWCTAAGLGFTMRKADIVMRLPDGTLVDAGDLNRSVLYRDDTLGRLAVMSTDVYKVVQPRDTMGFVHDVARAMGWEVETAGSLRGGKTVWAQAYIGESATLPGGDLVHGHLLASSMIQGGSDFRFASTRVVCANTLGMAMNEGKARRVKVYHFENFDVEAVKRALGVAGTTWATFIEQAKELAKVKITDAQALQILRGALETVPADVIEGKAERITDEQFLVENMNARMINRLYTERAHPGATMASADHTAWGLVNAATYFYDHACIARSAENRMASAWFDRGAKAKDAVFASAVDFATA